MSAYPSPWWFARHDEASWAVGCGDGETAVKVPNADTARLMCAAPEMLTALQTALRHARDAMPATDRAEFDAGRRGPEWMFLARTAIAKATGDTK